MPDEPTPEPTPLPLMVAVTRARLERLEDILLAHQNRPPMEAFDSDRTREALGLVAAVLDAVRPGRPAAVTEALIPPHERAADARQTVLRRATLDHVRDAADALGLSVGPGEDERSLRIRIREALGRGQPIGPVFTAVVRFGPGRTRRTRQGSGAPWRKVRLTVALRYAREGETGWRLGWAWRADGDRDDPRAGRKVAIARCLSHRALWAGNPAGAFAPPWRYAADAFVQHLVNGNAGHPESVTGDLSVRLFLAAKIHDELSSPDPDDLRVIW